MKEIAKELASLCAVVEAKNNELIQKESILNDKEAAINQASIDLKVREEGLRQREQYVASIEDVMAYRAKNVEFNAQNLKDRAELDGRIEAFNRTMKNEQAALEQKRIEVKGEINHLNDLKAKADRESAIEAEVTRRLNAINAKR